MTLPFFKSEKSLGELEEEVEKKEQQDKATGLELSIAQKKFAIQKLKENGLNKGHFGSWSEIWAWVKSHG